MPFYDYNCGECGKGKEVRHSIHDIPEILCECGNRMVKVLNAAPGIVYKGWGWTRKNRNFGRDRMRKSEEAKRRMRDTWGPSKHEP